jgi:diguanylate cyclase (GGDEF)-like protein/PAS domain S-box-containing protein
MNSNVPEVRRILVIDDNPAIHDDFRKILCPTAVPSDQLKSAAASLFGRVAVLPSQHPHYEIDVASRGQDGVENVRQSIEEGRPYALVFLDMRMPNGWNGLETTRQIWRLNPTLQIVLCTAFSDYSWAEIRQELLNSDRFMILKKPFDNIEVQQLADALSSRSLSETALRDKDRILHEAQQIARIGHYIFDIKTGGWSSSKILDDIFGILPGFVRDYEHWMALIDADDRQLLAQCIEESARTFNGFDLVCRMRRPLDAQTRWLSARGRWERDARGQPARLIGTFQDITQTHESQGQLRLLETCMAQINDIVMITNADSLENGGPRIVFVNDAFVRRTGYSREEVMGRSPRFLQGPSSIKNELDRITNAIRTGEPVRIELINHTRDGKEFWVDQDIVPVKDRQGRCTHWVGIQRDISEQKQANARIERLAYHDVLTGLANRRLLLDRLQHTLAICARHPSYCGLLFIDLDNFKELNDTFGHDRGDLLLVDVADRLLKCVREEDTIARFGGDEFAVLLRDLGCNALEAAANAEAVAGKITAMLAGHYDLAGTTYHTTASVGVTLFGMVGATVDELLRHADIAMYQSKTAGKNTYRFFDASMQSMVDERAFLGNELRLAMQRSQFLLHYQPQFETLRGLTGAEALLRWDCPGRGFVSPAIFVPIAEQTGLIKQLGNWVLETACRELVRWSTVPSLAHLSLAVNVSSQQFQMPDFVDTVLDALQRTGARAQCLKLELTESMLVHDLSDVDRKMTQLKSRGIALALDDFGTGYSSLSYLKRLSLDQLKIDQSFVRDVLVDVNDATIARTIVALGQSLGLEVIAEGVETQAQKEFLQGIGCNAFQGYLFGRPVHSAEFERLAADWCLLQGV